MQLSTLQYVIRNSDNLFYGGVLGTNEWIDNKKAIQQEFDENLENQYSYELTPNDIQRIHRGSN